MKLLVAFSLLILSNFSNLNLAFEKMGSELAASQQQQQPRRTHPQQGQLQQMVRSVNPSARRPPPGQPEALATNNNNDDPNLGNPSTDDNNSKSNGNAKAQQNNLISLFQQAALLRSYQQQQQQRRLAAAAAQQQAPPQAQRADERHMIGSLARPAAPEQPRQATSRPPLDWLAVDKRSGNGAGRGQQQQQTRRGQDELDEGGDDEDAAAAAPAAFANGLSRAEVISIFLDEMAKHNFELPAAGARALGQQPPGQPQPPPADEANLSEAILSQLARAPASNEQQLQLGLSNRLRGRSAGFLAGESAGAPLSFRLAPDGGPAGGLPKRTANGHIPCYFNAITCF